MPADSKASAIPDRKKTVGGLVRQWTVAHGASAVTFVNNGSTALDGKHVTFGAAVVPGELSVPIAWLCHAMGVPRGMEVRGRDETDVPPEWLPVDCRPGVPS